MSVPKLDSPAPIADTDSSMRAPSGQIYGGEIETAFWKLESPKEEIKRLNLLPSATAPEFTRR